MKKIFVILLLLVLFTSLISAEEVNKIQNFVALKAGYGNETGGLGVALDLKFDVIGLTFGAGYFEGTTGYDLGVKLYADLSSNWSLFGSMEYGLLANTYSYTYDYYGNYNSSSGTIFGIYFLLGAAYVSDNGLYLDSGLGMSVGDNNSGILAGQASIGLVF